MYRNVRGFCNKENKDVNILIECIPYKNTEGTIYAKGGINCLDKEISHHCAREDCPIWVHYHP